MGRLTEMIVYINSTTQDWQKTNGTNHNQFTNFNIDNEAKKYRRWYKYGKEDTYEEYLKTKTI